MAISPGIQKAICNRLSFIRKTEPEDDYDHWQTVCQRRWQEVDIMLMHHGVDRGTRKDLLGKFTLLTHGQTQALIANISDTTVIPSIDCIATRPRNKFAPTR